MIKERRKDLWFWKRWRLNCRKRLSSWGRIQGNRVSKGQRNPRRKHNGSSRRNQRSSATARRSLRKTRRRKPRRSRHYLPLHHSNAPASSRPNISLLIRLRTNSQAQIPCTSHSQTPRRPSLGTQNPTFWEKPIPLCILQTQRNQRKLLGLRWSWMRPLAVRYRWNTLHSRKMVKLRQKHRQDHSHQAAPGSLQHRPTNQQRQLPYASTGLHHDPRPVRTHLRLNHSHVLLYLTWWLPGVR